MAAGVIFLLALSCVIVESAAAGVSAEKTLVWGPGLDHNIHLPVHYVFIQAVDEDGRKYVFNKDSGSSPTACIYPSSTCGERK